MTGAGEQPAWNDQQAAELFRARVLIGTIRLHTDSSEQEQMFGVIEFANDQGSFEVALEDSREGETFWLPPDLRNFFPAQAGEYRLRSTGEVVIDLDYTSSWMIQPPAH